MMLDPSLWPLALPLALILVHAGLLPPEHPVRLNLARLDAIERRALGGAAAARIDAHWPRVYWTLTAALALAGFASLGAWLGWLG